MRNILLASAAVIGLALAAPAMAQTPTSSAASNIAPGDTRSTIAPSLPVPAEPATAGPRRYLQAAHDALSANHTGEAQEALERAEARLLDRSTPQGGNAVDTAPMVTQISDARAALGRGDAAGAMRIVDAALARTPAPQATAQPMPTTTMGSAPPMVAGSAPADDHRYPVTRRGQDDMETTFTGASGDNGLTQRQTNDIRHEDQGPAINSTQ